MLQWTATHPSVYEQNKVDSVGWALKRRIWEELREDGKSDQNTLNGILKELKKCLTFKSVGVLHPHFN